MNTEKSDDTLVKSVLNLVVGGGHFDHVAHYLLEGLADGRFDPRQEAALLTALAMRGVSENFLYEAVQVFRARMRSVPGVDDAVDCCGTGGDGQQTLNISTAAALTAAAAGAKVAKHGNRAVSSRSGSTDVLEALGVRTDLLPSEIPACLQHCGIAYMAAPMFHPALMRLAPLRRQLGFRTFVNLLGPLLNPCGVRRQLIGVADPRLLEVIPGLGQRLGYERLLVVQGYDGTDELSVCGDSRVSEWQDGWSEPKHYTVHPEQFGLGVHAPEALRGDNAECNAAAMHEVFAGERGAYRDAVQLNAGAVLYLAGKTPDIAAGVALAGRVLDDGRADQRLNLLIEYSQTLAEQASVDPLAELEGIG